jgi:hypothetical protein
MADDLFSSAASRLALGPIQYPPPPAPIEYLPVGFFGRGDKSARF